MKKNKCNASQKKNQRAVAQGAGPAPAPPIAPSAEGHDAARLNPALRRPYCPVAGCSMEEARRLGLVRPRTTTQPGLRELSRQQEPSRARRGRNAPRLHRAGSGGSPTHRRWRRGEAHYFGRAAAGTLLEMSRSGVIQVRAASLLHRPTPRKGKEVLVQRPGLAGMQHNAAHQRVVGGRQTGQPIAPLKHNCSSGQRCPGKPWDLRAPAAEQAIAADKESACQVGGGNPTPVAR